MSCNSTFTTEEEMRIFGLILIVLLLIPTLTLAADPPQRSTTTTRPTVASAERTQDDRVITLESSAGITGREVTVPLVVLRIIRTKDFTMTVTLGMDGGAEVRKDKASGEYRFYSGDKCALNWKFEPVRTEEITVPFQAHFTEDVSADMVIGVTSVDDKIIEIFSKGKFSLPDVKIPPLGKGSTTITAKVTIK